MYQIDLSRADVHTPLPEEETALRVATREAKYDKGVCTAALTFEPLAMRPYYALSYRNVQQKPHV